MKNIGGYAYNDYELLYLITCGNEVALELMFKKYEGLIVNTIKSFHIVSRMFDDFFMEGQMMLFKAIRYFREDRNMSFTNFFKLLLRHRYIDLLKINKKDFSYQVLTDDPDSYGKYVLNDNIYKEEPDVSKLSLFEKRVYEKLYLEYKSIKKVAEELGVSVKQIYTANARIKNKVKCK